MPCQADSMVLKCRAAVHSIQSDVTYTTLQPLVLAFELLLQRIHQQPHLCKIAQCAVCRLHEGDILSHAAAWNTSEAVMTYSVVLRASMSTTSRHETFDQQVFHAV